MKNRLSLLYAAVAASLSGMVGYGRTAAPSSPAPAPKPEPQNVPPPAVMKHARIGSATPPRPKRAKRRRGLHGDKAARYLRFCWSAKPWGARTPIEHAHGAQRRNAAILKNTGYEQRSRHVGTRWAGPARESHTEAGEVAGLSLQ